MNSRERVQLALNHQEADRLPLDLGGCGQTGMHVSSVHALRQALRLDPPDTPVKVIEPYQMDSPALCVKRSALHPVIDGQPPAGVAVMCTQFGRWVGLSR
jgi:hypothetical protein